MRPGQDVLEAAGTAREWLLTDGVGSSACGTETGMPLCRAHAWLHAAGDDGRVTTVLLGFEEWLHLEGSIFDLSPRAARERDQALRPARIESFTADPWPAWRLRCGDLLVERALFLVRGHPAVAVTYRHLAGPAARLRLAPLVVARDPNGLQRETPDMQGVAHGIPGRVRIETTPGRPTLTLWHHGAFMPMRAWRRGIEYPGDPHPAAREDALLPGHVECPLPQGGEAHLVASTEEGLFRALAIEGRLGAPPPATLAGCVTMLARSHRKRTEAFLAAALRGAETTARQAAAAHGGDAVPDRDQSRVGAGDAWACRLVRAVDLGLARQHGRLTLLDGFPAARERSCEVLQSLPGLIAAGAFEEAHVVLDGFIEYLDDGVVPSGFAAPHGTPRYDDPEPALWLLHAAELLARRTEDVDWARKVLPQLESIVQYYRAGSHHGIRVDPDGLLEAGGPGPHKPAVLNVLWYHALIAMSQLARLTGRKESAAFHLAWARQHGQCFNQAFWDEARGCLYESLSAAGPVAGFSPGQLLAVSLPPALLAPERAARLLARAERELHTPLGMRPAAGEPRVETAWLGAYYTACFRVHGRGPDTQARVRDALATLRARLDATTLDYVPATFEPPPGRRAGKGTRESKPGAWLPEGVSTVAAAELLRVWVEEVAHTEDPAAVA